MESNLPSSDWGQSHSDDVGGGRWRLGETRAAKMEGENDWGKSKRR